MILCCRRHFCYHSTCLSAKYSLNTRPYACRSPCLFDCLSYHKFMHLKLSSTDLFSCVILLCYCFGMSSSHSITFLCIYITQLPNLSEINLERVMAMGNDSKQHFNQKIGHLISVSNGYLYFFWSVPFPKSYG